MLFAERVANLPPAVINDLTPTVTVEVFTAQLTAANEPMVGVGKGWVREDSRNGFSRTQTFLETKQVTINTIAVTCIGDVLDVSGESSAEKTNAFLGTDAWIGHGIGKGNTIV